MLASSCGVMPSRSSRSNIAYSSCATTIWGRGSTRFGEPLIVRSVCSLPPSSSVASAPAFLRRIPLGVIHIQELELHVRDTKRGREEITREIPNVAEESLVDLDER